MEMEKIMNKIVINEEMHGVKIYEYGMEYVIDNKVLKEEIKEKEADKKR